MPTLKKKPFRKDFVAIHPIDLSRSATFILTDAFYNERLFLDIVFFFSIENY